MPTFADGGHLTRLPFVMTSGLMFCCSGHFWAFAACCVAEVGHTPRNAKTAPGALLTRAYCVVCVTLSADCITKGFGPPVAQSSS